MHPEFTSESGYKSLLVTIKQAVASAQAKAALAVNSALIQLYWNLGKMIADNQALFEGRNNYVERLANDLKNEFPEMKGFSRSNLFYMRKFFQFYSSNSVQQAVGLKNGEAGENLVQQLVALNANDSVQQAVGFGVDILGVPWGHHVVLLDKAKSVEEALLCRNLRGR